MGTNTVFLGIEIGGTKLQIVAGDGLGRIERRWRGRVDRTRGAAGILEQLERALRVQFRGLKVRAATVGFGGPVDWRQGRVAVSHQIEGWSGFELGRWAEDQTGARAVVENDSNLAALGEAHAAGDPEGPLFYTNMGSGVGGGLVVASRIYHGSPPGEVEFGHVRLDRNGTTVEQRCSGWAVDARIRQRCERQPDTPLARLIGREIGGEARHLAAALAQGDELARVIVQEVAEDLAFGLSHAVHLFHPARIVMGGGLSLLGDPLRSAVAARLPSFVMEAFRPVPRVEIARLGEDSVPVGALRLARQVVTET